MVTYIDTGDRNPKNAVVTWFSSQKPSDIIALRIQTGYFSYDGLDPLRPIISHLRGSSLHIAAVVGSNNGATTKGDLESLFNEMGVSSPHSKLAVVKYDYGLFHPKVFQIDRINGSKAAYIGSANLTLQGVYGTNIEAGVLLDTLEGDDPAVINDIASSIDAWFIGTRGGVDLVTKATDLDDLVASGVLSVSTPPRPPQTSSATTMGGNKAPRPSLKPLVTPPAKPSGTTAGSSALPTAASAPAPSTPSAVTMSPTISAASIPTTPVPATSIALPAVTASVTVRVSKGFGAKPALVAEIGGPQRWAQANFPIALIKNYFGIVLGTADFIYLSVVDAAGVVAPQKRIPFVDSGGSQNYRFELSSVRGITYPTVGRPIAVFLRTAPKSFNYRVFMPTDVGHTQLNGFLAATYIGPSRERPRVMVDEADVLLAWPNCPVLI